MYYCCVAVKDSVSLSQGDLPRGTSLTQDSPIELTRYGLPKVSVRSTVAAPVLGLYFQDGICQSGNKASHANFTARG